MADALRAALRLFPAVKSVPGESAAASTRSSVVKRSNGRASEQQQQQQSVLFFALPFSSSPLQQQKSSGCFGNNVQAVTGLARFARAVLAYVGAGISAVAANQLAGSCCIVHGKELPKIEAAESLTMATVWQHKNYHLVQDDAPQAPKLAHCPTLMNAQAELCNPSTGHTVENSPSFYNNWGSLDSKDMKWQQLRSSAQHHDYHSESFDFNEVLGSHFKSAGLQALAVECSNAKDGSAGYIGVAPEYASSAELELEWQLIADPKLKSGCPAAFQAAEANECVIEEDMIDLIDDDKTARDDKEEVHATREEMMAKSLRESSELFLNPTIKIMHSGMMCCGVQCNEIVEESIERSKEKCTSIERRYISKSEVNLLVSSGAMLAKSLRVKSGASWHTANKEALATLVAQKGAEHLQNCDLPTPQLKHVLKSPLESCDVIDKTTLEISGSMDQSLMAAILQAGEPTLLESLILPASPISSSNFSPNPSPCYLTKNSQPFAIPTTSNTLTPHHGSHSLSSADNRNRNWSGVGGGSIGSNLGKGLGLLGEALCHAQTRAREAEKKDDQTMQEYKKLLKLFFQEASLSLTYHHWVTFLQTENTWLKLYLNHQQAAVWLQHSFFSSFAALECLSTNHWKNNAKKQAHHQRHEHISAIWPEKDPPGDVPASCRQTVAGIIVGCTLGFAFALELSLASAGLVLGWSTGWILLAC